MARTPTLAGRFGGPGGVRASSVRYWTHIDSQAQETLDRRKEQVIRARIALIALAIVALIALALATRVAAEPVDAFAQTRTVTDVSVAGGGVTRGL